MAYFKRTNEAPMDFEYDNPQSFPNGLFHRAANSLQRENRSKQLFDSGPAKSKFSFHLPSSFLDVTEETRQGLETRAVYKTLGNLGLDDDDDDDRKSVVNPTKPPEDSIGIVNQNFPKDNESKRDQTVSKETPLRSPKLRPTLSESQLPAHYIQPSSPSLSSYSFHSHSEPNLPLSSPQPQQLVEYEQAYKPTFVHIQNDPTAERQSYVFLLIGLLRFGCHLALFAMGAYITIHFLLALKRDIGMKMKTYEIDQLEEYLYLQQEYDNNRCDPLTRLPGIAEQCRDWQRQLNRTIWVGKTKVLAETLAEILNGFFDTLSLKAMFFFLAALLVSLSTKHMQSRHVQDCQLSHRSQEAPRTNRLTDK
ncbi:Di-sulfide bridge nucleocytoplasmic transport domain-containing protein [Phycomyces nitens]|nr:Di-sulfide bridge nucleocytoplasmic transport domain-containing protein [Phycomyces nitens]